MALYCPNEAKQLCCKAMDNDTPKHLSKPFNGPLLLCIADGLGEREENDGNAVAAAKTPNLDQLYATCPHAQLLTHGPHVGLPEGQIGNSEVGHITIGSGRIVPQMLERIRHSLVDGEFEQSTPWQAVKNEFESSRAIHIIGLISNGGVHSHMDHISSLCAILNKIDVPVFIHAITDGRDTPPQAAQEQIALFEEHIKHLENVYLVDICGRYYAMDRDTRWQRTEAAYRLYVEAQGELFNNAHDAIKAAYSAGTTDEFIKPAIINLPAGLDPRIQADDAIFFANFRADRMRQLVRCFINDPTIGFKHGHLHRLKAIATMTAYDDKFKDDAHVMFPRQDIKQTVGDIIASAGGNQLRIAETEKYAHVTYFFNGGREKPFNGEQRTLIPSPQVKTYDLKPEMSLPEVATKTVEAIQGNKFDLIVLNIANGDMVGHTGNFNAAIKAVEAIDNAVGQLITALKQVEGEMVLIADHGNCEQMKADTQTPHTAHTLNPVPLIYFGRTGAQVKNGGLADVAPTLLELLGLKIPKEMTGSCRIHFSS